MPDDWWGWSITRQAPSIDISRRSVISALTMQKNTISLIDVPEAAVLAEPVLDAQQQVLLPAGAVLTPALVAGLRDRGVVAVSVLAPVEPESEAVRGERQVAMEQRLQYLFRYVHQSGEINPLLKLVSAYRQESMP